MRDLSGTELTAAQKSKALKALAKIVLVSGETTKTYQASTGSNRILDAVIVEEPDSITAQILLDNADGTLSSLDLRGYAGTLSFGATTSGGDEYSAKPGMKVLAQQRITSMGRRIGREDVVLTLFGLPNELAGDKANAILALESDDSDTVKTLTRKIVNDTSVTGLAVYDHCDAHDLTFGTEDTLLDSFILADAFSISLNSDRWSKLKEALQYTKCVARAEASDVLRIFQPIVTTSTAWVEGDYIVGDTCIPITANDYEYKCTTAGTSGSTEPSWTTDIGDTIDDGGVVWTVSYDYEYSLTSGEHTFLDKSHRTRLVIPNYIEVESLPSMETPYTGYKADTASQALMEKRLHKQLRVTSDAQCVSIATAILSHYQMDAERGHALVPINFGAEVFDFVKVTDASTYRAGNISYLRTHYAPGVMEQEIRFGRMIQTGLMGTMSPALSSSTVTRDGRAGILPPSAILGMVNDLWDAISSIVAYLEALSLTPSNPFEGYIWIDANGNINIRPKSGQDVIVYEDIDPKTDDDASLGSATKSWRGGFFDYRLKIPVVTDGYD